ncbi:MAG: heavy metal-binding domain-containing protein [Phycisphaerales bacterium]
MRGSVLGLTIGLLLGGCAGPGVMPPVTDDHPASVDAVESPYAPPVSVLFEDDADVPPGPEAQPASPDTGHKGHGMSPQPANPPTAQPRQAEATYTCPMHPEVIENAPGKCPKCGMKLVKKQGSGKHESQEGGLHE